MLSLSLLDKRNNVDTTSQLVTRLRSFGNRFWNVTLEGNASRLDSYMQQYMSAVISYAGTISSDFDTWINAISSGDEQYLYIPYTKDSLNSWTNYYNDPTALGVENWGDYSSPWTSGTYYDFSFGTYTWDNTGYQNTYNNFILNNSPVLYGPQYTNRDIPFQRIYSIKDLDLPDSLYILRGNTYQFYRWGYTTGVVNNNINYLYLNLNLVNNKINIQGSGGYSINMLSINSGSSYLLSEIISLAFDRSPFWLNDSFGPSCEFMYPYIQHVYLVDDLNTLSNKQEIFNTTSLDIDTQGNNWIIEPTDDDLYWQVQPTLVTPDMWDELVHEDETPATSEDVKPGIVNNTVINNYDIIAPGVVINVPVDWFNKIDDDTDDYIVNTVNYTLPFFSLVGDIFDVLGDIRIILLGILVLGLVAGVTSKFLL